MEREECEKLIRDKLVEIREIYKSYRGETEELYLSLFFQGETYLSFHNKYYDGGKDIDRPIYYNEF